MAKPASKEKKPAKKKKALPKNDVEQVVEEEAAEEKKPTKKKAKKDKKEGVTNAAKETGIIQFKEGSGSQDLLLLIAKHGFDRKKVIEEAEKLKKSEKAFLNCDPNKKYSKVAGIIKTMQNDGFKLPSVDKNSKHPAKKKSSKASDEGSKPVKKKAKKKKAKPAPEPEEDDEE